jgi:putative aldouronate transport system substrate-binding protein
MNRHLSWPLRLACLLLIAAVWVTLAGCAPATTTTSQTTKATTQTTQTTAPTTTSRAWPSDPNLNEPGVLPACIETVTLKLGVQQSPVIENWETNLQTLELEKDLNMDLTFEMLPFDGNELIQKIELMIMAGGDQLPDAILHNIGGLANLVKYGQMGMFIATNDYYENLAYFTEEGLSSCELVPMTKPDLLKYITCYDGNIYGIARFFTSINNSYSPGRIMIFEPWLEQLDLKMPQTTEEFANVLRAFKNNDPNQNGKPDEIPLMAYSGVVMSNLLRPLMNPFVYTQPNYYIDNNGKIEFAAVQEGWKQGLKYIKSLFDEELISPLSLTQDATQFNALMTQEETIIGTIARVSASNLSQADIRRLQYVIVDPLEGPTGLKQSTYTPGLPDIGMVITKNCATPEAAFILGDYMCGDKISTWTRYGREGQEWEVMATPGISEYASLGYKGDIKIISSVWGTLQNIWWTQLGPTIGDGSRITVRIAVGDTPGVYSHTIPIGRTIASSIEYANPNPVLGLIYNEQEQEAINEYRSTIEGYVAESFAQFVTGAADIDGRWDSYVAEFKKMGLDEYLAAVQSAFTRMNQ